MADRFSSTGALDEPLSQWGRFLTSSAGDGPLEPRLPADAELIRGELDRTQLDLITFDTDRHIVHRTPAVIERTPKRHIFMVQLRGQSRLTPDDGTPSISLGPGDVGYWTSEVPYRWEFTGPFTLLTLRAPYAAVDVTPATLAPLIGTRFSSDHGFARVVVPFAQQVLGDPELLGSQSGTRIVQNIVSLFTTMLLGELELSSTPNRSDPAFQRVVGYIAEHLSEPLSLQGVAAANDMSPRYLQALFQKRGLSVSEWIRLRRLERARQELADPLATSLSIGQISARVGLADQAHFSRVFRAEYGQSPSQWREQALAAAAPSEAR